MWIPSTLIGIEDLKECSRLHMGQLNSSFSLEPCWRTKTTSICSPHLQFKKTDSFDGKRDFLFMMSSYYQFVSFGKFGQNKEFLSDLWSVI